MYAPVLGFVQTHDTYNSLCETKTIFTTIRRMKFLNCLGFLAITAAMLK